MAIWMSLSPSFALVIASLLAAQVFGAVPPIIYGEPSPTLGGDVVSSATAAPAPSGYALQARSLDRRISKTDYLRILPLGASITQGHLSTTNNGYRKPLRDKLRSQGYFVNMVGTLKDGTMSDNVSITLFHSQLSVS